MLLSAVSVLVVAQSISEIPEGLMNNPVHWQSGIYFDYKIKLPLSILKKKFSLKSKILLQNMQFDTFTASNH